MSEPSASLIEYVEADGRNLDLIKPLWEKLNEHHQNHSKHFQSYYSDRKFESRKRELLEKARSGTLYIDLAQFQNAHGIIGYCASSISRSGQAEIDSIYIEADYRHQKIGNHLMEKALKRIKEKQSGKTVIVVAEGNEEVFDFYRHYDFYPRRMDLIQTESSLDIDISKLINNGQVRYSETDETDLDLVEPLWERLNEYQRDLSPHFAEYYAQRTFEKRKQSLLETAEAGALRLDLARETENGALIGYCISTISRDNQGKIESIYIEPDYRNAGTGHNLMIKALQWMNSWQIKQKSLTVVVGNEKVLDFYSRYYFYPRRYYLEQVKAVVTFPGITFEPSA